MLYDYLTEHYKEAEPIFFSDLPAEGISRSAVNQQLSKLCSEARVMKYAEGIYFLPKKSRLSRTVGLSADTVARYKYISRNGEVFGFYAGHTFANQLGISVQVPATVEIVSNHMSAKVKEVEIKNRTFLVRKPCVTVTQENRYVLQLLDLLRNLSVYLDDDYESARDKVAAFIRGHGISRDAVDQYIREFPAAVFKSYYELRLDYVFAQG